MAALLAVQPTAISLSVSPSLSTAANLGAGVLAELAKTGSISIFEPTQDDEPALSADVLRQLRECKDEEALVKVITPSLRTLTGLGTAADAEDQFSLVLINSERIKWLDCLDRPLPRNIRKKPDLFATWALCTKLNASPGHAPDIGMLAGRALQLDSCVCAFLEAKFGTGDITNADFGQLVDYHSRTPGLCRGMVFNACAFWLYESESNTVPRSVVKAMWGASGSMGLVRNFFSLAQAMPEPPLIVLMRRLSSCLGVVPCKAVVGDGSFLGAGGSGRVFAVRRASGAVCALKASYSTSHDELKTEFDLMIEANVDDAPVVRVVADSLHLFHDEVSGLSNGGGYMMEEVLAPFSVTSRKRCIAAFASLHKMHALGLVHGDARLPNLLERVGDDLPGPVWIDMRTPPNELDALRDDTKTLALSVLSRVLPEAVEECLQRMSLDSADYTALAKAVWKEVKGRQLSLATALAA